jgi:hypothetical protein
MLITNLEHFLAPDGSIAPKEGPALRLADYLTKIVVSETTLCQSQPETMACIVDIAICTIRTPSGSPSGRNI